MVLLAYNGDPNQERKEMTHVGKIEHVSLSEVWKHEALDFTPWLRDNIEILNGVLPIELSNPESEQAAGTFSVDLTAEDAASGTVIIENQLRKSDHDHLGKVVTYLASLDAKVAVWIVSEPRPEHIKAISWLNESRLASFFLVKVEAVRIGESPPAPLFTVIVEPSIESGAVGVLKQDIAERYKLRIRFWTELLEKAKARTKLHANVSPGKDNWIAAGAGKAGLGFSYVIRKHDAHVELYINPGAAEKNKAIFDKLSRSKDQIEADFGGNLEWDSVEGRVMCRIRKHIAVGGYRDEEDWTNVQDTMIDAMARLEKALKPHIPRLT